MDKKVAVEVLREVKEVLDKHNVEYWLDCGTLLGAVRDGNFIPWDSDIDFGLWDTQLSKVHNIFQELRDRGFEVNFSRIRKKAVFISLTFYHSVDNNATLKWIAPKNLGGKFLHCLYYILSVPSYDDVNPRAKFVTKVLAKISFILPPVLKSHLAKTMRELEKNIGSEYVTILIPSEYFMNLSTIKFYGMEFKVPSPVEEYLEYRYGKDWRTPKKDYVYYRDDGAIYQHTVVK